jgi:hypothetical protein
MSLSIVQAVANTGTATASLTIATPSAGNLLFLALEAQADSLGTLPSTITGWTAIGSGFQNTASGPSLRIYYRVADGTESTTQTFSKTGSATAFQASITEVHSTNGAFTGAELDQVGPGSAGTSGLSLVSDSLTPTGASFIAFAVLGISGASHTGTAFTNSFAIQATANSERHVVATRIVTGGSGSYSTTASWTGATTRSAMLVVDFLEPAAGGGGTTLAAPTAALTSSRDVPTPLAAALPPAAASTASRDVPTQIVVALPPAALSTWSADAPAPNVGGFLLTAPSGVLTSSAPAPTLLVVALPPAAGSASAALVPTLLAVGSRPSACRRGAATRPRPSAPRRARLSPGTPASPKR